MNKEIARLLMPCPLRTFGVICDALHKAYPNAIARQDSEWMIFEIEIQETRHASIKF